MTDLGRVESLNHRIRNAAAESDISTTRLRNRIAFQRVLARLVLQDAWILKGGFSLEIRLGLLSRATKDLDLLQLGAAPLRTLDLQDTLDEALEADLDDGFAFRVRLPKPVRAEEEEPSAWRAGLDVHYAGAVFGAIMIDIVPRPSNAGTDTESMLIIPTVVGDPFSVLAIDVERHTAEKFHAYSRIYAYERPSSRVKDLVDIVLLANSGLIRQERLQHALRAVFDERGSPLPVLLPKPPGEWIRTYEAMAIETGTDVTAVEAAWRIAADLYERTLAQKGTSL